MIVHVTCKNEEDPIKNEGARVVTTMLHYQSIFKMLKGSYLLNRRWDLDEIQTHRSFYSCPSYLKKIQSKMKALEWSQQYYIINQFLRCSRAANSLIGDGILTKFKLFCAFIVVLLICKNEYDLFKFKSTRVVTTFLPL